MDVSATTLGDRLLIDGQERYKINDERSLGVAGGTTD